jgi:hypothetical protein
MPRSLTIYRPWPWKFAGSRGGDGLAGRAGTVTLARAVRDSRGALARPGVIKVAVIRPAAAAKVSLRQPGRCHIPAPAGVKNGPKSGLCPSGRAVVLSRRHAEDQAGSPGPAPVSGPYAAFASQLNPGSAGQEEGH